MIEEKGARRIGTGMGNKQTLSGLGDKYRLLAQLGEGGTARVWLAMARGPSGFHKLVVLKTIRKELFNDDHVVEMFLEEARLAARLNHPNIVQTNEVFKQGRQPVIVMEYLEGLPFSAILERQREGNALALAMLLRVVSDALAGLHAAHELCDYDGADLHVVHRDVSPHNLFVTFEGEVKVLDFGIAQLTTSRDSTETGTIKGKLRYIAPEQISQTNRVDRRADIYSMGVVLWEVAAARRMWEGVSDAKVVQRISASDLPVLREVAPDVDPALAQIVEKCLATKPAERYPTALDLQTDVDQYVSTLGAALRNRDLGRALSKMFEDVRRERQTTIERQLEASDTFAEMTAPSGPLPELTSFSRTHGHASYTPSQRDLRPFFLAGSALVAMLLFIAAFVWPKLKTRTATTEDQRAGTVTTEPAQEAAQKAPQAPSPAERIVIRITAFPRDAELWVDGVALASNPATKSYARDDVNQHRLEVRAVGYEPEVQTLLFHRDQDIVLNLSRRIEAPQARPKMQRPKPAEAPAPPVAPTTEREAPPARPSCNPPHYFDERGVKKYRPECF